ncbi:T9SS type A sorting domain-containing protein [Hymenobacter sp. BT730]|uniref:T9SS type A sorting domain-containing protein n=1 Tax=Hymenobacter sp. BT730 TaxID=3063332 RepID=UPI0026E0B541|nr:T9SS type A sorting domain-containing protein [Hymenobacter sp. BT730]
MCKLYYSSSWPIVLFVLSAVSIAQATHLRGGQISYVSLGNDQYRVRVEQYMDQTSGASTDLTEWLVCKRNGCAGTGTGSFIVEFESTRVATTPATCPPAVPLVMVAGEITVTLPPGQWALSIEGGNRSQNTNLAQASNKGMYLQAFLDNTRGQADSSPKFTELEVPSVGLNTLQRYSFAAFDADGDLLVYYLAPAMWATFDVPNTFVCPEPMEYTSYSAGSINDPATGQSLSYPAGQFSAGFPFLSFRANAGTLTPWVDFNAATGLLQAIPVAQGVYSVAVLVQEYRSFNGTAVLIGSVLREVPYTVKATDNVNPSLTLLKGNTTLPIDEPINVQPGQNLSLTLVGTDPDAGQTLRLSSNAESLLPGATFQPGTTASSAQFTWQVPTSTTQGLYSFSVRVADDACPANGIDSRTITLHISGLPLAAGTSEDLGAIAAYPTPFTNSVQFQLPVRKVQDILVTDGLGREVARLSSRPDGRVSWQTNALPAGMYFARTIDGSHAVRLVKAK